MGLDMDIPGIDVVYGLIFWYALLTVRDSEQALFLTVDDNDQALFFTVDDNDQHFQ